MDEQERERDEAADEEETISDLDVTEEQGEEVKGGFLKIDSDYGK